MAEFEKEQEVQEQETQLEPQVEQETTQVNPKERVDTTMTWIDKVLGMLNKYSAKKVLQAILIIFVVVFIGLFAYKPEAIFRSYNDFQKQEHNERMGQRTDVTPQIQTELDKLRKSYGVSWVSVWEFHNNTNNLDGLPFIFASLNYESMNPALTPIAEQFDDVRVSLYPLVTYLRQKDVWYGTTEDLQAIDNTAYYRAKALGIKYLGFRLLRVEGMPNAAISFAFVEGSEMPENMNDFIQAWTNSGYNINSILSVRNNRK
jgi:hypothetical protein